MIHTIAPSLIGLLYRKSTILANWRLFRVRQIAYKCNAVTAIIRACFFMTFEQKPRPLSYSNVAHRPCGDRIPTDPVVTMGIEITVKQGRKFLRFAQKIFKQSPAERRFQLLDAGLLHQIPP